MIPPYGNIEDPKIAIIMSCPEPQDVEKGCLLNGSKGRILKQSILSYEDNCYVTTLCKEVLNVDDINPDGRTRSPTPIEVDKWLPKLLFELKMSGVKKIMPLGGAVTKALLKNKEGISEIAGKSFNLDGIEVIPNFDPGIISNQPKLGIDFQQIISKACMKIEEIKSEDKTKVLNYEECMGELEKLLINLQNGALDYFVFDTETTSLQEYTGNLIMYSWAHDLDERGFAVPLMVNNEVRFPDLPYDIPKVPFDITEQQATKISSMMGKCLEAGPIVGHNLMFDVKYCAYHGVADINKIKIHDDTYIMASQMFHRNSSKKLKDLAKRFFHTPDDWEADLNDYKSRLPTFQNSYDNLPTGMLGVYAAFDAYYNKILYKQLNSIIEPGRRNITNLITDAAEVFADVEMKGVKICEKTYHKLNETYSQRHNDFQNNLISDPVVQGYKNRMFENIINENNLKREKSKTNKRLKPLTDEQVESKCNDSFKINSNKQLSELLYLEENFNIPPIAHSEKTKKPSTNKAVVEEYTDKVFSEESINSFGEFIETSDPSKLDKTNSHLKDKIVNIIKTSSTAEKDIKEFYDNCVRAKPFFDNLGGMRKMAKILSTYLQPTWDTAYNKIHHPSYEITGTITGRMSSGLHTWPKGFVNDCKRLFVSRWADKGGLIAAPDYSQLELRVGAALAKEESLINAYVHGIDLHKDTASKMFGIGLDEVDSVQRGAGKQLNFGIFYGKGAGRTAEELGCTKAEAQDFIDKFLNSKPGIANFIKDQHAFVEKYGFIETPFGRKIVVDGAGSKNKGMAAQARRQSVNYPVQGTGSDLVTDSIIMSYWKLKEEKMKTVLWGAVHDSLEFDIYPGELFKFLIHLKQKCEKDLAAKHDWMTCPLEIGIEFGTSWGAGIEWEVEELNEELFVGVGSALRSDILELKEQLERGYEVEMEVLKKKEIDLEKTYNPSIVFVGSEKWTVKMTIKPKRVN